MRNSLKEKEIVVSSMESMTNNKTQRSSNKQC